jgi:hypothetical protein
MTVESVETLVEQRLATLPSKSTADLLALPKLVKELVKINRRDVQVFALHEISNVGRDRFILQAIQPRWGGITEKVVARGFEISHDRSFRMLAPEELYDFT